MDNNNQNNQPEMNIDEQTTNPVVPPEKSNSNNSKIVILILALTTILTSAIAGFFYWQNTQLKSQMVEKMGMEETSEETMEATPTSTPDPAADWNTYKTDAYLFKYPSDVEINESQEGVALTKFGPTQRTETELYDGISMNFQIVESTLSSKEYAEAQADQYVVNSVSTLLKEVSPITINGISGYEFTTEGLGVHNYIFLENSNSLVEIRNSTVDPENQGFIKTADQILSTFKFLEESGTMETATDSANGQ